MKNDENKGKSLWSMNPTHKPSASHSETEPFMSWGGPRPTRKNLKINDCRSILRDFKQFCCDFSVRHI